HDQSCAGQPEQLQDDIGRIARERPARAKRAIQIALQRELAAIEVVGDVDDLDEATLRTNESDAITGCTGVANRSGVEGNAGTVAERVVHALQSQVEGIGE